VISLHFVSIYSAPLEVFIIVVIGLTGVQFGLSCNSRARGRGPNVKTSGMLVGKFELNP